MDQNSYFEEVFIVEGKNDYKHLKQFFPNMDIMITDGSCVMEHIPEIKELSKTRKILIFTDPDFPGEKIRKAIQDAVPEASHCFLEKRKAISSNRKKVGIEHATKEDIVEAISHKVTITTRKSDIKASDLYALDLMGTENSRVRRNEISKDLHIGHPNAKTFLERLIMFGIQKDELIQECEKLFS